METPLPLSAGPRGQTKHNIVSAFFGPESDQAQSRQGEFTEFFQSYSAKLRQLRIGAISDSWEINKLAAQSHDDVLRICRLLADKKHLKRAEIRNILYASFSQAEEKAVDMSIDLAIRLWLMINVRDDELSVNEPSKSSAQWADQETLQDLTYRLFPVPKTNLTIKEARLGPTFNAAYLSDICGLEFYWTDNLQDHLLLHRRTRTLHIFADQGFLFGHLNATACNSGWYVTSLQFIDSALEGYQQAKSADHPIIAAHCYLRVSSRTQSSHWTSSFPNGRSLLSGF